MYGFLMGVTNTALEPLPLSLLGLNQDPPCLHFLKTRGPILGPISYLTGSGEPRASTTQTRYCGQSWVRLAPSAENLEARVKV